MIASLARDELHGGDRQTTTQDQPVVSLDRSERRKRQRRRTRRKAYLARSKTSKSKRNEKAGKKRPKSENNQHETPTKQWNTGCADSSPLLEASRYRGKRGRRLHQVQQANNIFNREKESSSNLLPWCEGGGGFGSMGDEGSPTSVPRVTFPPVSVATEEPSSTTDGGPSLLEMMQQMMAVSTVPSQIPSSSPNLFQPPTLNPSTLTTPPMPLQQFVSSQPTDSPQQVATSEPTRASTPTLTPTLMLTNLPTISKHPSPFPSISSSSSPTSTNVPSSTSSTSEPTSVNGTDVPTLVPTQNPTAVDDTPFPTEQATELPSRHDSTPLPTDSMAPVNPTAGPTARPPSNGTSIDATPFVIEYTLQRDIDSALDLVAAAQETIVYLEEFIEEQFANKPETSIEFVTGLSLGNANPPPRTGFEFNIVVAAESMVVPTLMEVDNLIESAFSPPAVLRLIVILGRLPARNPFSETESVKYTAGDEKTFAVLERSGDVTLWQTPPLPTSNRSSSTTTLAIGMVILLCTVILFPFVLRRWWREERSNRPDNSPERSSLVHRENHVCSGSEGTAHV